MSSSTKIHQAILAAEQTFMATYDRGDAAGVAALYTRDAELLPPNSDIVKGKQALQALFQSFMDDGDKVIKLETLETDGFGEMAYEVGLYTLESATGEMRDHGKYIVIWKYENQQWKLHRDIFNTSMPEAK